MVSGWAGRCCFLEIHRNWISGHYFHISECTADNVDSIVKDRGVSLPNRFQNEVLAFSFLHTIRDALTQHNPASLIYIHFARNLLESEKFPIDKENRLDLNK